GALENFVDESGGMAERVGPARPIGHQTTSLNRFLAPERARQEFLQSEVDDLFLVLDGQSILQNEKRVRAFLVHLRQLQRHGALRRSSGDVMVGAPLSPICREAIPMNSMRRDDVIWIAVVTLIALTISPTLKSIGLLPADVFRSLGIAFPGQPQIVFG